MIHCTNCHRPYPEVGAPYRCLVCGGIFDYDEPPIYDPGAIDPVQPGIWRYRRSFALPDDAQVVTLGEGNTPLVWTGAFGKQVAIKCEFLNPTGSFKDRGSALLVSFLRSRGVDYAVEDSSGNAGASFAAYAARGGMKARVYVPEDASGPKRAQIEAYGAEVLPIPGPRTNASEAVQQAASKGVAYASHAYLPFNIPGYATLAYELVNQVGEAPGAVICPVGQGGLLLGIGRGFQALRNAGVISALPLLVGVQAMACAPLWAIYRYGAEGLGWVSEGQTLAEGVRVRYPVRGDAVLKVVEESGGQFVAVEEANVLPGRDQLAARGFYVETTSAIVWDGLSQVVSELSEPVVVILTGSGFKSRV